MLSSVVSTLASTRSARCDSSRVSIASIRAFAVTSSLLRFACMVSMSRWRSRSMTSLAELMSAATVDCVLGM